MTTYLNQNFARSHADWENANYTSALWVNTNDGWSLVNTFDDPYDGIEPMVSSNNPCLLEMFGKATNTETDEVAGRVRVLFSFDGEEACCSMQFANDDELITDSGTEGHFMDYFTAVRMALA